MKKVVIIGGGFAGAYAARKLEPDFTVTLIDSKDYFEFTPSVLRTIVEPEHLRKIQVLHSHYLHKAQLVREEVKTITKLEAITNKQRIPYDYLIIASGSTYNTPIKEKNLVIATRAQELRQYAHKLQQAKTVLIIGGGLVGVELAAEIVGKYPEKEITLVHAKEELIERNPPKARQYARQFLERHGVRLFFHQRIVRHRNKTYVTDSGMKFGADIAFLCTGIKPNYEYLQHYCSASLDERQNICVDNFLQVQGYDHIFAAGDITSIAEEKTAQNAEKQAEIVVKNVYHLDRGEQLEHYQSKPRMMVISLGKWNGIMLYKDFVLTGIIPGLLKSLIEWKTMKKYREFR